MSTIADRAHKTPDEILGHPQFPDARDRYIDAVLDLYEGKPRMIELMLDGGRMLVYGIIMALWGGYRTQAPASRPTIGRLKETVGWFGVASPRQIDLIIARFSQVGHLRIVQAQEDLRMRLVLPTEALIEHDCAFIRAHYAPLAALYGRDAYALPLAGDLAFLKAMRGAWVATLDSMAREIVLANRPILRFYAASAGMLMLMKLARLQAQSPNGWVAVNHTDFGRRFAVSRTHVRMLLRVAVADGEIESSGSGMLRISPTLISALDHNIAGRLSLLERASGKAMAHLTGSSLR